MKICDGCKENRGNLYRFTVTDGDEVKVHNLCIFCLERVQRILAGKE